MAIGDLCIVLLGTHHISGHGIESHGGSSYVYVFNLGGLTVASKLYTKELKTAPVAQLAARGSHNPKVASSILVGSKRLPL